MKTAKRIKVTLKGECVAGRVLELRCDPGVGLYYIDGKEVPSKWSRKFDVEILRNANPILLSYEIDDYFRKVRKASGCWCIPRCLESFIRDVRKEYDWIE